MYIKMALTCKIYSTNKHFVNTWLNFTYFINENLNILGDKPTQNHITFTFQYYSRILECCNDYFYFYGLKSNPLHLVVPSIPGLLIQS